MKSTDEVFAVVRDAIIAIMGVKPEKIAPTVSLKELGANSLDRVEIVTLSMENLGLNFPPRELGTASNIGGLVALLHARLGS